MLIRAVSFAVGFNQRKAKDIASNASNMLIRAISFAVGFNQRARKQKDIASIIHYHKCCSALSFALYLSPLTKVNGKGYCFECWQYADQETKGYCSECWQYAVQGCILCRWFQPTVIKDIASNDCNMLIRKQKDIASNAGNMRFRAVSFAVGFNQRTRKQKDIASNDQ